MVVPDTAANTTRFPKQGGNHGGCGYPLMRVVVLVACGTRTLIDAVFGPAKSGETTYAWRLLPGLHCWPTAISPPGNCSPPSPTPAHTR